MNNKTLDELLQKVNVVKMHCSMETMFMVLEDKITKEESFIVVEDTCYSRDGSVCLGTEHLSYQELINREAYDLLQISERRGEDCKVNIKEFDEGEMFSGFCTKALSSLSWLNYKDDRQIGIDVNNRMDELIEPKLKEAIEFKSGLVALKRSLIDDKNYEGAALVRKALRSIK